MTFDEDKVDDLTLALLYLVAIDREPCSEGDWKTLVGLGSLHRLDNLFELLGTGLESEFFSEGTRTGGPVWE